jgi:uncharacterized protein (TIGR02246 family)
MKSIFGKLTKNIAKVTFMGSLTSFSLTALQMVAVPSNTICYAAEETTVKNLPTQTSSGDEQMIRSQAHDFIKAFAAGDADAIVNMCAEDCCFTNTEGVQFNGRAEIKKMYEHNFQTFGLQPISLSISKVSFPAPDIGIEDGQASYTKSTATTRYNVVHVKKDGTWKMLRISEFSYNPSPAEALKSVSWMIGDWTLHGKNKNVYLKVHAINNGNFLALRFSDSEGNNAIPEQLQIIGWSLKTKDIVSWNFGHEGGFGYGHWHKVGDDWFIQTKGVTHDGSDSVADYIIKHPDNNHFSWQSLGRSINGVKLPSMEIVDATRQQTDK